MSRGVEFVKKLLKRWSAGERKGYVLTLTALVRLKRKGEPATLENVTREGLTIIRETTGTIDWGVSENSYTVSLVSSILKELAEIGVIEPLSEPNTYRFESKSEEEFLARFGHILQLVRMPK